MERVARPAARVTPAPLAESGVQAVWRWLLGLRFPNEGDTRRKAGRAAKPGVIFLKRAGGPSHQKTEKAPRRETAPALVTAGDLRSEASQCLSRLGHEWLQLRVSIPPHCSYIAVGLDRARMIPDTLGNSTSLE